MQYEELIKSYAGKSDEELLRLQLDSENLTMEASTALTGELARRGINGKDRINAFRHQEEKRKEELAKDPGSLFFSFRLGVGRWYFGKADRVYDSTTRVERFRTTVFIVLLFFPVIPTGAYLVEKRRGFLSGKVRILKKLPLDWEQVLKVWVVAALAVLAVILLLKWM
jgi:hypothetical protein